MALVGNSQNWTLEAMITNLITYNYSCNCIIFCCCRVNVPLSHTKHLKAELYRAFHNILRDYKHL